jgi:hypothetical protein
MTSITIVVGTHGWPTHASLQLNEPGQTTYFGFGPQEKRPRYNSQFDVLRSRIGESPVGRLDAEREFHYVDADHYSVKSFTIEIPDGQADAVRAASDEYIRNHPMYDFWNQRICTDYVLHLAQRAIPGSDLSKLSRLPDELASQLSEVSKSGNGTFTSVETAVPPVDALPARVRISKVNTGLADLQADRNPPQFKSSDYTGTFDQRFSAADPSLMKTFSKPAADGQNVQFNPTPMFESKGYNLYDPYHLANGSRDASEASRSVTFDPTPFERANPPNLAMTGRPSPTGADGSQYAPSTGSGGKSYDRYRSSTDGSFDDRFRKWDFAPAAIPSQPGSDLPGSFNDRFGNWGSAPANDSENSSSPIERALRDYRRSEGPASSSAQNVSSATPAYQSDVGYSSAGDLHGGFPNAAVAGAAPSPAAFNMAASSSDPRTLSEAEALWQRLGRLASSAGQFVLDSVVSPAEAASVPSIPSGPTAPDLPDDEAPVTVKKPERYLTGRVVYPSQATPGDAAASTTPDVQDQFNDRFGDWMSSPAGSVSRGPDQPAQVPQTAAPPGPLTGQPMPRDLLPHRLFGLQDPSNASNNAEDWVNLLIRPYRER